MPIFEELKDPVGIAKATRLAIRVVSLRGRISDMRRRLEAALAQVAHADDIWLELPLRSSLLASHFHGETPLDEYVPLCRQHLDWASANRVQQGVLLARGHLAVARAMQGDVASARRLMNETDQMIEGREPSITTAMHKAEIRGNVERLAADSTAAEQAQREGYAALEALGESGFRSTIAGLLAQTIYDQGRYEEAGRLAEICKELAASDDLASQVLWRGVRAKVLARRGEMTHAEQLAREGKEMIEKTEYVTVRADALLDLAEVLHLAGKADKAVGAAEGALALFEAKGNVVKAERTRALVANLSPQPSR
jgi:ATP/maltotriose-dependent transcriptional regulator MalT